MLDGSGSFDVDNDPLTYQWSLLTVADGSLASLSGANTVSPTFVADAEGLYVAQLIANDGTIDSDPDTVVITAELLSTLSIDDVSVTEGNTGTTDAVFSVTLSDPIDSEVTVEFANANGTATAPDD